MVQLPQFSKDNLLIDPLAWPTLRGQIDTVYIHAEKESCKRRGFTVEQQGRLSMHAHAMLYGGWMGGT